MTVEELINYLQAYPKDAKVIIEVKGRQAPATDVDWAVDGAGSYTIITDYPVTK